ncbi:hypothetical protein EXX59_09630 [Escherichia coli]|nr:hypothetical protein EXX59_09630 [Escherichia coli]
MYRHKGIPFQATRILQSPEGVSLRSLKHWLAVTRRRSSQTAGTLAGSHPKALLSDCWNIGWSSEDDSVVA